MDFGIAKLLHEEAAGGAREQTATGFLMMTPEYVSPEQICGARLTTASDVYSLGVVLYELLIGRRSHRFKSRRPDQMARVICDTQPERPSAVVCREVEAHGEAGDNGNCETRTTRKISEMRGETSAARLRRRLRGDLDNIALMALRKEPARRYASVEQFSEDVRRHLDGLPVSARKSSYIYQAQKFVGRNRTVAAAAARSRCAKRWRAKNLPTRKIAATWRKLTKCSAGSFMRLLPNQTRRSIFTNH